MPCLKLCFFNSTSETPYVLGYSCLAGSVYLDVTDHCLRWRHYPCPPTNTPSSASRPLVPPISTISTEYKADNCWDSQQAIVVV